MSPSCGPTRRRAPACGSRPASPSSAPPISSARAAHSREHTRATTACSTPCCTSSASQSSAGLEREPFAEDLWRACAQLLAGARERGTDALRMLEPMQREPSLRLRARLAERAGAWAERRDALERSARAGAGSDEVDLAREALREATRIDRSAPLVRTMAASLARSAGGSDPAALDVDGV